MRIFLGLALGLLTTSVYAQTPDIINWCNRYNRNPTAAARCIRAETARQYPQQAIPPMPHQPLRAPPVPQAAAPQAPTAPQTPPPQAQAEQAPQDTDTRTPKEFVGRWRYVWDERCDTKPEICTAGMPVVLEIRADGMVRVHFINSEGKEMFGNDHSIASAIARWVMPDL
jgi:hypothetical protein